MTIQSNRLIGKFEGSIPGPLFIVIGGIHGNEPAGVKALERLFAGLDKSSQADFAGVVVGLKGNMAALEKGIRQINEDLNRILTPCRVEQAFEHNSIQGQNQDVESSEIRGLIGGVRESIERYQPNRIVVLDLHTTTADGGAFAVTSENSLSESIAQQLGAPVVRGILNDISGMTLSYFCEENLGIPCVSMVFESGQHDAPESIETALAAVIRCASAIGMPFPDTPKTADELSGTKSPHPQLVEVVHTHYTTENDGFLLKPGFTNFHPVSANELLGKDNQGDILSPLDGMMLMPRYLQQGIEGFLLVKTITS